MKVSVWASVHVHSSPPTIYWWFGKCTWISAALFHKFFIRLVFFFMFQTKMGSFVIKTTGTWVRWNSELGIISVRPNSCTQALT